MNETKKQFLLTRAAVSTWERARKPNSCQFIELILTASLLLSQFALRAQSYTFTVLAGQPSAPGYADGTGSAAQFNHPSGLAVDNSNSVYVADSGNNTIRKITPAGQVTTLAGRAGTAGSTDGTNTTARFDYPICVTVDNSNNVYVTDYNNQTIRKITPVGVVTTLAGLARNGGSLDGTGSQARFWYPRGMAVGNSNNLYVADTSNNTIRRVTPAGVVTTLAGLAGYSGWADGVGSDAQFNSPDGLAVDTAGNVYVADCNNSTVRKITPEAVVTTLAGLPGARGSADGSGGNARFGLPCGMAIDSSGWLHVLDYDGGAIRNISPTGVVTTSWPTFQLAEGIAVDGLGNLYVADTGHHMILKGTMSAPQLQIARGVDGVILTWPSFQVGFTLESSTNLTGTVWSSVTSPPMALGGQSIVSNGVDGTRRYYRLRR